MTDLVLASLNRLVFARPPFLAAEWILLRPGLSDKTMVLLARFDGAYDGVAMGVIVVGAGRGLFGLKGGDHAFWAKMAAFALVGIFVDSADAVYPALAKGRRRHTRQRNPGGRSFLRAEIAVFALMPILAAILARGVGY